MAVILFGTGILYKKPSTKRCIYGEVNPAGLWNGKDGSSVSLCERGGVQESV